MASKKRRAKRRKKSASKLPFVLLVAVMGGVGALLVVSAQNSISGDSSSPTSPETTLAQSSVPEPSAPADDESDAPAVTIGSVAPPVSIDTDDADDDDHNDTAFVLADYTPTETPEPPSSPRTISDGSIDDGRVTGTIPDGFYLGYIDGVASSTSLLIRFDASDGPTHATPIDDLLFVSLRVDARDPSHPGSAVVAADTLVRLVEQGRAAYSIPESDDFVVVEGSYLITVADGRLVGIEGLS